MISNLSHIPFETLADFAEHRLVPDKPAVAHLATCQHCAQEFTRLENLVRLMRTDDAIDAARDVRARAVALFRRAPLTKPSLKERLVASLSFDSLNMSQAYGVRSAASAAALTARQMLFEVGDVTLDLRITENEESEWMVSGQLVGDDCARGRVVLQNAERTLETTLNDVCEFALPRVPAGVYGVRFDLETTEISIPDLRLGD